MSDKTYPVPESWKASARVDADAYHDLYERSVLDPKGFWAEQAQRIDWIALGAHELQRALWMAASLGASAVVYFAVLRLAGLKLGALARPT